MQLESIRSATPRAVAGAFGVTEPTLWRWHWQYLYANVGWHPGAPGHVPSTSKLTDDKVAEMSGQPAGGERRQSSGEDDERAEPGTTWFALRRK